MMNIRLRNSRFPLAPRLKSYLALCRISNLPTVWTNVLAAVVLSGRGPGPLFFLLLFSTSLFYAGGMCLNDLWDAELDHRHKPLRPIPAGKVLIPSARRLTMFLFGLGLAPFFFFPFRSGLIAGFLLVMLIVTYNWFHKSHSSSILLMAGCRLMVFVVASLAVSGNVNTAVAVAGILQFTYILVLSAVARMENHLEKGFSFPVIPIMLACISAVDGIVMAVLASPFWLLAGAAGMILTCLAQSYVRGD